MFRLAHFGRIFAGRIFAAVVAATILLASAYAQTTTEVAASLEPLKLSLDVIEQSAKDAHGDQAYAELSRRLTPLREELRGKIATLEPRLAQVDTRLKQLGDPPAANAPPEDPAVAAERTRLVAERSEVDGTLKQAKLLTLRVEQLGDHINELRRTALTDRLLARSAGLFDPAFWRDAASHARSQIAAIDGLLRDWWSFAREHAGFAGLIAVSVGLALLAAAAVALAAWWRRWIAGLPRQTRFGRAAVALISIVSHSLAAPAVVVAAVLALEDVGLLSPLMVETSVGFAGAVAIASFGRAVAVGFFAPGEPDRRLVAFSDEEASALAIHLTSAARLLGLGAALQVFYRSTGASASLAIATGALFAFATALLAIHLVLRFPAGEAGAEQGRPRLPGLRALLWLVVAVVMAALVTGYIGLAAFLASRVLAALGMLCAFAVASAFVDALFAEVLTANTDRGRKLAYVFGLSPRGFELIGTLLSAVIRLVLALLAVFLVLGPWGGFAAELLGSAQDFLFGFRIGEVTISITAILTALAFFSVGVLIVRIAQRWLETRLMPRTALDPGLQNSISALLGYTLLIAVIAIALSSIGVDLQKIALVAGALSVGIGFGLQSVVSNFVSGVILLAERPIRVGDWVVVKNEEGIVRRISVRATEIETFDRASVIIPNSDLITGVVKNLTHSNTMGRVTVKVRVAYDGDVDEVRDLLIACACDHPQVLQAPPPRVYLVTFGDIGLEFELRCIVANVEYALTVKSDLQMAILQRFRQAGIKIPFPPHEERPPGTTVPSRPPAAIPLKGA
jgi:potassium efflux system protein